MFKNPIAISLAPNMEQDDVFRAIKILFQLWNWKRGKAIQTVENWFKAYFKVDDAVSFNSGRSALYALLKSFNIGAGDEVIVQAFTCVAVPEPIIWVGARPKYIDVDESINLNVSSIEKYINRKTKAIIVQHTFGIAAKINLIKKIAQKYNLILIEDCSHSLGATFRGKKIGTFGDASFFSFGRDKILSSVFGGLAFINNKEKKKPKELLRQIQRDLPFPSYFWILQQLLHPICFAIILPFYNLSIGKLLLVGLQKINLLSKPVEEKELIGRRPKNFPCKYPNALADLLVLQLKKLEKYNKKRREIANYYYKKLAKYHSIKLPHIKEGDIFLRFNILTKKAKKLFLLAKSRKILLGNWYRHVIDPERVIYKKIFYSKGSCPNAEQIAKLSVNLPTYVRLDNQDRRQIIKLIEKL